MESATAAGLTDLSLFSSQLIGPVKYEFFGLIGRLSPEQKNFIEQNQDHSYEVELVCSDLISPVDRSRIAEYLAGAKKEIVDQNKQFPDWRILARLTPELAKEIPVSAKKIEAAKIKYRQALAEAEAVLSGQRALVIRLAKPIKLGDGRVLTAIKLKGVIYRPYDFPCFLPPLLVPYEGIGTSFGTLSFSRDWTHPQAHLTGRRPTGTMFLTRALKEYLMAGLFNDAGFAVEYPLGFGRLAGEIYEPELTGLPAVGFVMLGLEEMDDSRLFEAVVDQPKEYLEKIFYRLGQVLRQNHDQGLFPGAYSIDNCGWHRKRLDIIQKDLAGALERDWDFEPGNPDKIDQEIMYRLKEIFNAVNSTMTLDFRHGDLKQEAGWLAKTRGPLGRERFMLTLLNLSMSDVILKYFKSTSDYAGRATRTFLAGYFGVQPDAAGLLKIPLPRDLYILFQAYSQALQGRVNLFGDLIQDNQLYWLLLNQLAQTGLSRI